MFGYGWHHVVLWLAQCWLHGWHNVDLWLVQCCGMIGATLACGWCNVGLWLAQRWLIIVGETLAYSWFWVRIGETGASSNIII